ncbi:MAG: hypothetical protein OK449_04045 [Thaumarchaeota archaeon]|nr:hypothetical protein [Nitrososphaerota archaeon]
MPKLSKKDQLVLMVIISSIVLAFGIVVLTRSTGGAPAQSNDTPTMVYVSGDVLLRGAGDTATSLNFTDTSGHVYSTVVQGESYATFLPNNRSYIVTIGWVGSYIWQKGVVTGGTFFLDQNSTTYRFEFSGYDVPPSNAELEGLVNATGVTPTAIILSGVAGNFTSPVNTGQYSVQVPNLTSYAVQITWQGGECSAGTLYFDYSPGITHNLTCSK